MLEVTMGDGTVTLGSLERCLSEEGGWAGDLVEHKVYAWGGGMDAHTGIVKYVRERRADRARSPI
jgi:hypothetical protein